MIYLHSSYRLGLVARMSDTRHPKQMLFGWLPQKCPAHGAKLCWQDKVRQDLKKCKISESSWYKDAQDRIRWKAIYSAGLNQHMMAPLFDNPFVCTTCHRSFGRR